MFKYTFYVKDNSPATYTDYLYRLLSNLRETVLCEHSMSGVECFSTNEGTLLIQELFTYGAIKVNSISEYIPTSIFDNLPENCTLYVIGDNDLFYSLMRRYPRRNIMLIGEYSARKYYEYSKGLKVTAYLVYSENKLIPVTKLF